MAPGWRWTPVGILRLRSWPRTAFFVTAPLGLEGDLKGPDGQPVAVLATVEVRIVPGGVERLARAVRRDLVAEVVAPAVGNGLAEALRLGAPRSGAQDLERSERVTLALANAGLDLLALRYDAVGTPERVRAAADRAAGSDPGALPGARVLLVGWDGADWNVIDPLLARGELPHLQGLMRRGLAARLRTVAPVLSPVIWTSMATGVGPDRHGIVDFLAVDRTTGARVPVTSNLRTAPALWTLLAERNLPVGIVAWWATWPAERVVGSLVTDRIAYQLFGLGDSLPEGPEGKTWPPELFAEIQPLIRKPEQITDAEVRAFAELPADLTTLPADERQRLNEFRTVLAATRTYGDIALHLARRDDPVLRAVYFEASDTAAHLFMGHAPPRMASVSEAAFQRWNGVVDAVYRDLDRWLGELLRTTDENTTVLVVSDHGFRTGEHRPLSDPRIGAGRAADWHRKYGILVAAGPGIEPNARLQEASVLDIAPTILALLGLPIPTSMEGEVLEAGLSADLLRRRPPVRVAHDSAPTAAGDAPIASPGDADRLERLRTLGYVSGDEPPRLGQDEATAFNNRGTILLSEGRAEEAISELRRGLERAPGSTALRVNLARALRHEGRDTEALPLLLGVLQQDPEAREVQNLVGNIYLEQGDLDRAEAVFREAVRQEPNFVDGHVSLGILAERRGRWAAALEHYERAARIDPDSAEAPNNIGNVHRTLALQARQRGDAAAGAAAFGKAEQAYRRALEADPDFIGTYNNLGLILQDLGRVDEAAALYRAALNRDPAHAVVHNNLGSLHFARGELEAARREFEAAITAQADYESAWNNLGAVLGRLGRPDEELAAYEKAVALAPDYADGQHNLGLAYLARGRGEAGEKALLRAVELQPDYLSAWVTLGGYALRQGRAGTAVERLGKALAINPALTGVRNQLGEARIAAGDAAGGRRELLQSLRDNPDQPQVRVRLQQLPP